MANKLSIDGVIFQGKSAISSWKTIPLSGGIKVDWGDDDVEVLGGETWNLSSSTSVERVAEYLFSYNIFDGEERCVAARNKSDLLILNPTKYSQSGIQNTVGPQIVPEGFRVEFSRYPSTYYQVNAGEDFSVGFFHKHYCGWGGLRIPASGSLREFGEGSVDAIIIERIITSNTGATSTRTTSAIPTVALANGGCELAINYVDGTSALLSFPECPTDIFLVEDEVCQNTCNIANSIINKLG